MNTWSKGLSLVDQIAYYSNFYSFRVSVTRLRKIVGSLAAGARPQTPSPEPQRLQRRLGGDAVKVIAERYAAGDLVSAIAEDYGVGKTALYDMLRRQGVDIRRQGITPANADAAHRLVSAGMSMRAAAAQLGISRSTLYRFLTADDH